MYIKLLLIACVRFILFTDVKHISLSLLSLTDYREFQMSCCHQLLSNGHAQSVSMRENCNAQAAYVQ